MPLQEEEGEEEQLERSGARLLAVGPGEVKEREKIGLEVPGLVWRLVSINCAFLTALRTGTREEVGHSG